MKIVRSFLTVSGLNLLARATNFIRDLLFASVLGAGIYSDAFLSALKLMSVFKSFFSDGPLSAVLVPILIKDDKNEKSFTANILTSLIVSVTIITILLIIFAPLIIKLLMVFIPKLFTATQVTVNLEKITLTAYILRIMLPYCIFVSISSFIACLLQVKRKAWAFSIIALIVNCALIGGSWLAKNHNLDIAQVPILLSKVLTLSAIAQIAVLYIIAKKNNVKVSLGKEFYLSEKIKEFGALAKKFVPIMLSGCIDRTSSMISITFANSIPGLYSYIHYANKIVHIPMYVIGTSMSTVFLPEISTAINEGKQEKANFMQNRVIEFLLVVCAPITLLHLIFSEEIVINLLYRGKFTMENVINTAKMLRIFSFSIPAMILSQILTTSFFARQDTKTPMKIALFCFGVNIIANMICIKFFDRVEVALINNVMLWLDCSILFYILQKKNFYTVDLQLLNNINKIAVATCAMLVTIFGIHKLESFSVLQNTFTTAFVGMLTYCVAIYSLKVYDFKNLHNNFQYLQQK